MATIDSVEFLENVPNYTARSIRRMVDYAIGEGVVDYSAYRVSFSAGLTVNVSAGVGFIRGNSNSDQGLYRCTNLTNRTVTLPAADATNPRIDQIVLQVQDAFEDAGAGNQGAVTFLAGTPTAGATLDNRNGVAPLAVNSPSLIVLADVLVNANNSPALSTSSIRDRRPVAVPGTPPVALGGRQMVMLEPLVPYPNGGYSVVGTDYATRQSAFACYLPTRIPATHFRWKYRQDQTNPVGTGQNWNMAICDASGRLIAQTGNVAFAGAANTAQQIARAFSPALPAGYMFEMGAYYIWFSLSGLSATQTFAYFGWRMDSNKNQGETVSVPGLVYKNQTSGTTFDASGTLVGGMTDVYNDVAGLGAVLPVPQVALSVG